MRDVGEMQLSATVLSQEDLYLPISPLSDPYISPVSPAAVLPQEAKRLGLGRSLFERLQRSAHPVTIPHTQLPIPRLYLACISPDQVTMLQTQLPIPRLYLACISPDQVTMLQTQLPIPRLYLACISPGQVTMLQTQFRMHPAIRAFPSRHFYGNRLVDAEAVALLASRSPGAEGGGPGFL